MKVLLTKLLAHAGQTVSMSEGRRLVIGGIVRLNGSAVTDIAEEVEVNAGDGVTIGARRKFTVTTEMLEGLK